MDKRSVKTQFVPQDLSIFSADELRGFRNETRRSAAWNRRAALLRAGDNGADPNFVDTEVELLEKAFQNESWMEAGDAAAQLQPITQLPSADEVARLAHANNDAAQTVATIALASQLVDVATTLLNIANGRIPASVQAAPVEVTDAAPLPDSEPAAPARMPAIPVLMGLGAMLLLALAGAGMVIAARRPRL